MTLRGLWRRVAYVGFFLLGGVVVAMQVLNSLQVGREDGLLVGRTVAPVRRVEQEVGMQRNHWYVESWLSRTQQGEDVGGGGGDKKREGQDGDSELSEVRMARELHDLRINRLNNFARRTGSLLADQQQRNSELRLNNSELRLNGLEGAQRQEQGKSDRESIEKSSLQAKWNVSRIVESLSIENREEALALENKLRGELDRWYDMYAAKQGEERNDSKKLDQERHGEEKEDYEEDYTEEYEEDEEEEEGKRRVFDPEDFDINIAEDGRVIVTRKQLGPEVLVENLTTTSTLEEWRIMLTLRYGML